MSSQKTALSWGNIRDIPTLLWHSAKAIARTLWGEFESWEELGKFLLLAFVFFFVIGVYWTLRPLKDSLFNEMIGIHHQPIAKILSMFIIFPLVIVYSKLIDLFARDKVFYCLIFSYALVAAVFFAIFHYHPQYGLIATKTAGHNVYNIVGWAWYVYVESFGSIIVALFWAIASDVTLPEAAKRGFPLIVFFGQLGNVLGPTFLRAKRLGTVTSAPVVAWCAVMMICAAFVLFIFMNVVPKHLLKSYHGQNEEKVEKEQEPGFLEGLYILFSHSYLLGIFFIVTVYEVIQTFVDFHFKVTVMSTFDSEIARSGYLADYAVYVGVIALISLALGIGRLQKLLGVTIALLFLPTLILTALLLLNVYPSALTVVLSIMVFFKAVNYALNQPMLKQLYIPTTHDTKYKAQAWGDMFGSRGAKAGQSIANMSREKFFQAKFGKLLGVQYYVTTMTFISLGLIGVWFLIAFYIARVYNRAIKENRVVC